VNASLVVGQSLQLNATPTLFVNGRKLEGAVPWETLQVLIKMELDHQAAAAAPAAKDDCCTVKIPTIIK
jgi:hypothetical protein